MDVIYRWFEKQVLQTPNAMAICDRQRTMTYKILYRDAAAVAVLLREKGVKPDTLVALCLPRSIEQLTMMLGILIAGGAFVPLDPLHTTERIQQLIVANQISICITSKAYQPHFENLKINTLFIEEISKKSTQKTMIAPPVKPENLAYLIHTSGSTGVPKGVLIEQQSVMNYCRFFQNYAHMPLQCRVDYSSNYIFDMAITTSLVSLLLGSTLVLCDDEQKQNPQRYLKHLKEKKIQLIKITPSYLRALLQELEIRRMTLPDLNTIILGGENLCREDCAAWLRYFPKHRLFNEYGPTETTVAVTQQLVTSENIHQYPTNIPIGKPGLGVELLLLNPELLPVSEGEMGELYIGGSCLARGYHNQALLTNEKFIHYHAPHHQSERFYKTGDMCLKNQAGEFEYLGRVDRQIKIRGYRVELTEIEHHLRQHPMIQDAVVILSTQSNQSLLAYCIPHPQSTLPDFRTMRHYLLAFLPSYMIPRAFITLDHFPLTSNGKLDEKALPLPDMSQDKQKSCTPLEQKLINIWAQELGLTHVGKDDSFYALGGHSLNAARIVSAIEEKLKKSLSLAEFYQAETITQLATMIKHRKSILLKKSSDGRLVDKPRRMMKFNQANERLPLSDFQLLLWISRTFEPNASRLNLVSRKRFQGNLDTHVLNDALQATLKRHEILNHRITGLYPAYRKQNTKELHLFETTLTDLSIKDSEVILQQSMQALLQLYPWPKGQPLVLIKVFYLKQHTVELQLCMPHLIADEVSLEIFWNDLSRYYLELLSYPREKFAQYIHEILPTKSFHDYVKNEQQYITNHFDSDSTFWNEYFSDSELVIFPETAIVRNMKKRDLPYSTYYPFPEDILQALHDYCARNHLSIEDALCVAVDRSLRRLTNHQHQSCVVNMVKSTRQDRQYDDTIGCFLRIDPVKIEPSDAFSLLKKSKRIRQVALDNTPFCQASTILKLAHLAAKNTREKKHFALQFLIRAYSAFLNQLNLHYKVLQFGAYFSSFKRDVRFITYMNLWHNFISPPQQYKDFLGQPQQTTPMLYHDLSSWDNLCDISFLRDTHLNQPYVVVSSNLQPTLRKKIAETICSTLKEAIEQKNAHVEHDNA